MWHRISHTIQAAILLAVTFIAPGLLGLSGYWSGVAFIVLGLGFSAWAFYRAWAHDLGPLW